MEHVTVEQFLSKAIEQKNPNLDEDGRLKMRVEIRQLFTHEDRLNKSGPSLKRIGMFLEDMNNPVVGEDGTPYCALYIDPEKLK